MLVLVLQRPGQSPLRRTLGAGTLVIGSGDGATLRIDDDAAVAKLHAVLDVGDDGVSVLDLGSTRGTRVNGATVRRAALRAGDAIAIGGTTLTLEEHVPAPLHQAIATTKRVEGPTAVPNWLRPASGGRAVEIAQLWGDSLVGLAHFDSTKTVLLGETSRCTFFVPADRLPCDEFPLLAYRHGEPFVRVARGLTGTVERNGETLPLAAWLARGSAEQGSDAEIPLAPGERVKLEVAPGVVLLVQRVERTTPIAAKPFDATDLRFLGVFASLTIGLALIGTFLKLLGMIGLFSPSGAAIDDLSRAGDIIAIFQLPTPEETPLPRKLAADPDAGIPDAGSGAQLTGDPGKIGDKEARHVKTRGGSVKMRTDEDVVNDSGVLGAMRKAGIDVPAIFGGGQLAGGIQDNHGGIEGLTNVDQIGVRGFALAGDKNGGGGKSLTVAGFNPNGRRVRGGLDGNGDKPGRRGTKPNATIGIDEGESIISVGLDPALIQAVITSHLPQLQYCYERRLGAHNGLGGKVLMKFTIDGVGLVSSASVDASSTLADDEVRTCMVKRFKTMRFPKPPGGGTVGVKYPFLFKTAGN